MISELALTGIVIAFLAFMWKKYSSKPVSNLPPGPIATSVFGNFKDLDTDGVHKSLHALFEKYGPIIHIRLLRRNIVILNTSETMRKAFDTTEFEEALNDKAKGFYGTYLVYGHADILLGPYNERTFKLKSVMHKGLMPSMSPDQLKLELEELISAFKDKVGKDFCPRKSIESIIAKTLTMMIAGECKDNDQCIISDFVFWSNKLLNPRIESMLKNLPFLRHLPCEPGNLYVTVKSKRDILLQRFLTDYRETYKPGVNRGLVDTCLNIQDIERQKDGSCWLNDDMIRALILDTIGGGFVSTSNTILAAILNLLHHESCLKKMTEEIKTVLGTSTLCTWADVKIMPYSFAVVLETQRYSTIVPIVSHYCSKKDVEFDGFTIPSDTMVWGNIWSCHHDESVYKNPWTFDPERFLDNMGNLLPEDNPARKSLIPLGIGKRYCVGSDFAMSRLFTYIVTLIQHFDILPPKDTELVSCDPNLYSSGAVLEIDDYMLRVERKT